MTTAPLAVHRLTSSAGVVATISRRAAALRGLTVEGIDLIEPTTSGEPAPGLAGATLAPWPNRVEGARWDLYDAEQVLEVTEPEFGHANHGLLLETDYEVVSEQPHEIALRTVVHDRSGYPFCLEVSVRYSLDPRGVRVRHDVRNLSKAAAPFAMGAHPYLRVGEEAVETSLLRIAARTALTIDATHIPRGTLDVAGTPWDLRAGRRVAEIVPHAAYTHLESEAGVIVHRLTSPSGRCVELWAEADFAWVQVYVANDFDSDLGSTTAIAIEPMTAPPNALRTGEGLRWLEPGERWTSEWGIRLAETPHA